MNISNLKNYLYLLRPEQWLKNIVIFFPAFFGLALDNFKNAILCTLTFISFCLISSSIYIVNDLIDLKKDRKHSSNSKRPIASGLISTQKAFVISLIIASASLFIALQLNIHVSYLILLYFVLMVIYSIKLKNIALVDLLCIATGFELRVFAGCWVIGHSMTVFLFVEIFLLCSLMVLSKRYIENNLKSERKTLLFYTPQKCRKSSIAVIALSVFIYILYCLRGTNIDVLSGYSKLLLSLSIIPVIYGLDYFYINLINLKIDYNLSKTIYKDWKMLLNSLIWLLLVTLAFYAF